MKKINQYKLLAGICVLSLFTACDFEELNTNPFEMTDEMGIRDGVAVGGAVMAMQRAVITVPITYRTIGWRLPIPTHIRHCCLLGRR